MHPFIHRHFTEVVVEGFIHRRVSFTRNSFSSMIVIYLCWAQKIYYTSVCYLVGKKIQHGMQSIEGGKEGGGGF